MLRQTSPSLQAQPTLTTLQQVAMGKNFVGLADVLSSIGRWLQEELKNLDLAIQNKEHYEPPINNTEAQYFSTYACSRYIGQLGGKRLRPLVTLLAERLFVPANSDAVYDFAVAAELVHTATLLHDDVLDEGSLRRGKPSANVVYGNAVSVLAGDHLLVRAIKLVQQHDMETLSELCSTLDEMVAAEALQLNIRGTFKMERALYNNVVDGKTAALFRWAFMAGGAAAGCSKHDLEQLKKLGTGFGVAYQIVDDILDLSGDTQQVGKRTFADVQEGKLTLPLICACEYDEDNITFLRSCAGQEIDETRSRKLQTILKESQAIDTARTEAHAVILHLYELLDTFGDSDSKMYLQQICAALEHRIR